MVKLRMLGKTLLYLLGWLLVIPMAHWHIKMDDARYAPYTLFKKEEREREEKLKTPKNKQQAQ